MKRGQNRNSPAMNPMMNTMRKAYAFLLFSAIVFLSYPAMAAPLVTVSGTSITLLGTSQTISLTCTLIDPASTGMLRVSGSGIITNTITSTVTPNTTATCGPIYGNDVIINGNGNVNSTYYEIQVFVVTNGIIASTPSLQNFYAFTGSGTIDLATATPTSPGIYSAAGGNVTIPGNLTVVGSFNGLSVPASGLVGVTDSQTLTNKTVSIASNTLLNSANVSGHYPRNNGTQYVDSTIQSADLPATTSPCSAGSFAIGLNAGGTPNCSAGGSGFKVECTSVSPVTVANTVSTTALISSCTIPANDIGVSKWFYIDAYGIVGDVAAPTLTLELDLDAVQICSWTPTLAAANTQPWGLHAWFNGITAGGAGSVSGCVVNWSSTPSGGSSSSNTMSAVMSNATGVSAPPQSVTVDTTSSHILQIKVTWGTASASNTITQNNMIVTRIN